MEQNNIYSHQPLMVLAFHGCEKTIRDDILNSTNKHLKTSDNPYDWLGKGIYFWLNDPIRALEWAKQRNKKEPAVLGAIIDLGECLDLCERDSIILIQHAYELLKKECNEQGIEMSINKTPDDGGYNIIRNLDCAVIQRLHIELEKEGCKPFDTVKGYFQESKDAYDGASIKEKSHIQICVRNTQCIKGYFLPR